MIFKNINNENRVAVNNFILENWFSTDMIIRGKIVDMTNVDGIAVFEDNVVIGLITYIIIGDECEITSLDSIIENKGVGTELLQRVSSIAKKLKCKKIKLITTNDNINAMKFYQKRGFDMVRLYHNAMDVSRKLKPSIPMTGEFDIPLKHEIEFEMLP